MRSLQISAAPTEPSVASVCVRFQNKAKRPRNGIFAFDRAKNGTRAKKGNRGRERGGFLPFPSPPPLLLCRFFARFFFAPKQHGNVCYVVTQAI